MKRAQRLSVAFPNAVRRKLNEAFRGPVNVDKGQELSTLLKMIMAMRF
jgi:hypothetical protein